MSPVLLAMLAAGAVDKEFAEHLDLALDSEALQDWAERTLDVSFGGAIGAQQSRLLDLIRDNPSPTDAQWDKFWEAESEAMWKATGPAIVDVASTSAMLQAASPDLADTFNFVNQKTLAWTKAYYTAEDTIGSIPQLNRTSREQFASAFVKWSEGSLGDTAGRADGFPQLIRATAQTFGPERAERIAVTEATRIRAESQRTIEAGEESTTYWRVLTSADEKVCEICGPLHGKIVEKSSRSFPHPILGAIEGPPFHVRCRCAITPETDLTVGIDPLNDDFVYQGPDAKSPDGGKASEPTAKPTSPYMSPDVEGFNPQKVNDWFTRNEFQFPDQNVGASAPRQKAAIAEQLASDLGLSPDDTSNFIHQWAVSSNDNNLQSLGIQRIAADEFGTELSVWQKAKLDDVMAERNRIISKGNDISFYARSQHPFEYDWAAEALRAEHAAEELTRKALRSAYNTTQAEFAAAGVDEIVLYRGIKLKDRLTAGEVARIEGNALESWSIDPSVARRFAGQSGNVITAKVPASRIFSTARTGFGCLDEYEFVVFSSNTGEDIVKVIQ